MNKKAANSDIRFLVLARPADLLCTIANEIIPPRDDTVTFCTSVYDALAALHAHGLECPVALITRPSMLSKPHLATVLRQYANLRLIGWLGPDERPSDNTASLQIEQGMVTVSSTEHLLRVIDAIRETFTPEQPLEQRQPQTQDTKLDPADYRLSHDELDALLGAEK